MIKLGTYNVRTLLGEDKLEELESAIEDVNWDIIGLSEVRHQGESYQKLKSGHLYHIGGNKQKRDLLMY